jgi:hypothetical protein
MEALSGVASCMAVASLSMQLVQSIGTINSFIRGVRDASKELERLAELLDRLSALLEDVRDVMERQTMQQDQYFPSPSMSIFNSLKSCDASLQSLQKVVKKYTIAHGSNASALERLKEDIKFGFKMKDISDFEARIQRDIDYLHVALGLNNTSILYVLYNWLTYRTNMLENCCTPGTTSKSRRYLNNVFVSVPSIWFRSESNRSLEPSGCISIA